jgi:cytosine/adenosine deaminase-related metal-dependent hydrolase
MKAVRASHLVTKPGCLLEDGGLLHENGKILAVGRWPELQQQIPANCVVEDAGEAVLFPGLINAHCHLDYSTIGPVGQPGESFPVWLEKMGRRKRALGEDEILHAIGEGCRQAVAAGTTTLLNIAAFPQLLPRLPPLPARMWWFFEMTDMRGPCNVERVVRQAEKLLASSAPAGGIGLAPHAPYTASVPLYEQTQICARKFDLPWTTHVAESAAEWEMFLHGTGPLAEFLRKMGRKMNDTGGTTPLARVLREGFFPEGLILVHGNYWNEEDLALLARSGSRVSLVHCPSSHRFFGHQDFAWEMLHRTGARLALGTDSPATGGSLDLREELRLFRTAHPHIAPSEIWSAVTTAPAAMLGRAQTLGQLQPGADADFVCWDLPDETTHDALWEALLWQQAPPRRVIIAGRDLPERIGH